MYRIDPSTGNSVFVGDGANPFAGDIAVDPTNLSMMYGAVLDSGVRLVTIDRDTGAQTDVGSFGIGAADIWGMGFSIDGQLFAAGPDETYTTGKIYTIDKTTGAATLLLNVLYQPYDMATQPFITNEIAAVPEPGTLALALVGGAVIAGLQWKRRKAAK